MSTAQIFRPDGTLNSQTIIHYNTHQEPIKKEEFRDKDQLRAYWTYTYDSNDLLSIESYFSANGQLRSEKRFVNKMNNAVKDSLEVEVYENKRLTKRTFKYIYADSSTVRTITYEQDGLPSEVRFQLVADSLTVKINGFYEQNDTSKLRSRFREIFLYNDLIEYESRTISGTKVRR